MWLKCLFFQEMLEEFKHPDIVSPNGKFIELDFFFPGMNLAVEYQVNPQLCCHSDRC